MTTCGSDDKFDWAVSPTAQEWQDYGCHSFLTEPFQKEDASTTPPPSQSPSPTTYTSVSNTFYPGSHPCGFDIIFSSSDGVLFYVHSNVISGKSKDAFHQLSPSPHHANCTAETRIIAIPESSATLDVILHVLYGMPCTNHAPSFSTVVTAIDQMPTYSICPKDHISPSNPNYAYILAFAPVVPLDLYALAGHHDLLELATATSSHLLSHPLATIDDLTAARIGAVYFKRLFYLHMSRFKALKDILLKPPYPHPPSKDCNFANQKQVTRTWALVTAYLAWEARADLSTSSIQSAFRALEDDIACGLCQFSIEDRLKEVVTRWACVNRSIESEG
ncbi:hypothetical protein FPV67DRAFT_1566026 [Lyophyllum atratum]|nr:hypothetical protein FPV67DRAFT_1566026 [Lyophyllum atratum]